MNSKFEAVIKFDGIEDWDLNMLSKVIRDTLMKETNLKIKSVWIKKEKS